jgi:hypothetical protein
MTAAADRLRQLLSEELTGADLDVLSYDDLHALRTLLEYWTGIADRHVRRRQLEAGKPDRAAWHFGEGVAMLIQQYTIPESRNLTIALRRHADQQPEVNREWCCVTWSDDRPEGFE